MNNLVKELIDILKHEREIYENIFHIEEEKSEAIIDRNGKLIEEFSLLQEKFLNEVEALEDERTTLMKKYKSASKIKHIRGEITLQEIIDSIDSAQGELLKHAGIELKNILLNLTKVQSLNSQLLMDNMEFYDIIISGLKN
ncbi:MAG: flagellar protein FlgN, partial [Leptospirales bacterium]|nr:flagellar protein FlgN [Leptospirales bacterium]